MSSSTATLCFLPVATLRSEPFSLDWGDSVFAKVVAVNSYGNSLESSEGNGAKIITAPDAPENLVNNAAATSSSQIGLSWAAPLSDGGSEITSYTVSYDLESNGAYFIPIASGVTTTSFIAYGMSKGSTY